ncbi:glycosyltransferase family 2 protein [Taibaiella soli]|uniref:Glycosyltransferase 2-like domain-containing protein n=1 Tax=Taibaiella soli TaxID=1649169 RepID=A0A2W2BAI0_9BACT|nr:glycosyltransferase family 2 protein [Taibaiella soli]PZF73209.1 hypothetical protein DN068_10085 [Taibaiella soli]
MPLISICVPAYKRPHYLKRLLDSITIQTFKNFEIILTDDSDTDIVIETIKPYNNLPIKYFRNTPALGTPENWNAAISRAESEWIKIMHDDDWFSGPDSLQEFADAIQQHPGSSFFFSAYTNIFEDQNNRLEQIRLKPADEKSLKDNLLYLFRMNYIGNPSCTLYRKNELRYDKTFAWVVDFEFYIRYLTATGNKFTYIDKSLVNVGMNASQVTKSTFRVSKVEVPENHTMLTNFGFKSLKNIYVYDYFWRMYRNLKIRDMAQIAENGYNGPVPPALESMIAWQKKFPLSLLRFGPFSKSLMFLHYLTHSSAITELPRQEHR